MTVIATLGPQGSNHDNSTRRYIEFRRIAKARILHVEQFADAFVAMRRGEVDLIVQVCAHPEVASLIEANYRDAYLVDSYIAPTKSMGVVTRRDVAEPESIGLLMVTQGYFDLSRWKRVVPEFSNGEVYRGLLEGRYDSGFTSTDLVDQHPDRFRVDKLIGEVDLVWMVYGRERVRTGPILAWPDAPVTRLFS